MPEPRKRSRTLRRIHKKLPGGKTVIQYSKRIPQVAKCAICKGALKGVPRLRPFKMKSTPKTEKRPERPFGGFLCSKCTRNQIKSKSRSVA